MTEMPTAKKQSAALVRVPRQESLDLWATRITSALQKTVEGIFETGHQLLLAREALPHGEWEQLFQSRRVPMTSRSAQMFIEIYKRRELLTKAKHGSHLPASWTTLYLLARLPDDTLEWAQANGKITPDLERSQVKQLSAEYAGEPEPETSAPAFLVADALTRLEKVVRSEWKKWPPEVRGQFLHSLQELREELRDASGE